MTFRMDLHYVISGLILVSWNHPSLALPLSMTTPRSSSQAFSSGEYEDSGFGLDPSRHASKRQASNRPGPGPGLTEREKSLAYEIEIGSAIC